MSKPSPKSIGSLIGEVRFLSLHHMSTILGSKNGFSSTDTKRLIAQTSSHHSSNHPSTKKSHTKYGFFFGFFPGLDVMPFPTTPSTRGKRAGQELKSGTSKSP